MNARSLTCSLIVAGALMGLAEPAWSADPGTNPGTNPGMSWSGLSAPQQQARGQFLARRDQRWRMVAVDQDGVRQPPARMICTACQLADSATLT